VAFTSQLIALTVSHTEPRTASACPSRQTYSTARQVRQRLHDRCSLSNGPVLPGRSDDRLYHAPLMRFFSLQRNSAVSRCLGLLRPRLSRFDFPCHNISQPDIEQCLASCPCGFNFRQPDDPVYTAQPGVVTSRRRSWDLVLRSIIPGSRAVAVSSIRNPHAVNELSPSIYFRRGTNR
jgi:hypothetical protein